MYQTSKFVGAVRYNMPKSCATLLCRALRRVTRMCSSTLSDPANRLQNKRCGNPTAVPLFSSGRRSLVCARLSNKGKVGVQRGRETAGVPSFLPLPRGAATFPPRGAANPPLNLSEKLSARQGEHACAVRAPRLAGAEKSCRPDRTNTLTQFAYPRRPVLHIRKRKKDRPHSDLSFWFGLLYQPPSPRGENST